ncbi:MAG TPA: HAMP domain-containing sensor histidine kinase [Tepidiformaceae bacterium]|nr:HAMP domain-containing sensor histidine kinase [Tepidiformaceae bacterium]
MRARAAAVASKAKYLLVWPAVAAYRRRARRSIRWRLAGYNLATLVAGLVATVVIIGLFAAWIASARDFAAVEPAEDARAVARFLADSGLVTADGSDEATLRPVLEPLAAGQLVLYRAPGRSQFDVRPHEYLKGTSGLAFRPAKGGLVASSGYRGTAPGDSLAARASGGASDLDELSARVSNGELRGVGAYPVTLHDGAFAGVVVVEKRDIQAPSGPAILLAEIRPVAASAWTITILMILPGAAVATFLAVIASRSLAGRVRRLSLAASSLAGGDLSARAEVDGEDEVASLGASFNGMAERLESAIHSLEVERERALGLLDANQQLVANVSHELRTPVAVIRGQVEALDEDSPGNPRTGMALREIDRLESLVSDLFALASARAGDSPAVVFDAVACARDAVAGLVDLARREAGVSVASELPAASAPVLGDPRRLAAVVQNLVRNGIRHTPEGGIVLVQAACHAAEFVLTVRDTGEGIPAADLPHVFERFYRGDDSRSRKTGGAGLGLAIAREFIESMDGAITVESPPGEGAVFTVRLPLASTPS